MTEVIQLKKGARPPAGAKALVVESVRGLRGTEIIQDARGLRIRINPREFDEIVADLVKKGTSKIYVRDNSGATKAPKPKALRRRRSP